MRHKQAKAPFQALALDNLLTLIISIVQLVFCPLLAAQDTPQASACLIFRNKGSWASPLKTLSFCVWIRDLL